MIKEEEEEKKDRSCNQNCVELSIIIRKKQAMERRRLQQQKIKEQQRFSVSQQDLTEAIARMKPVRHSFRTRRRSTDEFPPPPDEIVHHRSVSQLIKEFEARTNFSPYASAQDLFLIVNDLLSNGAESNCSHMPIRTMKRKDESNDNDIINNNVCSPISHSINDDNQMVTEEIHPPQKFTGDRREEKNDDDGREIHPTLHKDRHKQNLSLPSSFSHNHLPTAMIPRSTDIDAAALTLGKRHELRFEELLTKEAQLNHALAELISISNDIDESSSMNSLPSSNLIQPVSNSKTDSNISASIHLLNNLLDTFDLHDEDAENKISTKNNDENNAKPINMFW